MVQKTRTIGNIQLLRGLAATSVVVYHTNFRFPNGVHTEFYGVAVFFVISGFIMVFVSRSDASQFFTRRVMRIVPLYWLLTLIALVWYNFGFSNPPYVYPLWLNWLFSNPSAILQWFEQHLTNLLIIDTGTTVLRSLFFWPWDSHPLLSVGWTLNIEMFFYAVFGICLRLSKRLAPLLASVVLVALFWLNKNYDCGTLCRVYGHDYVIFFVF